MLNAAFSDLISLEEESNKKRPGPSLEAVKNAFTALKRGQQIFWSTLSWEDWVRTCSQMAGVIIEELDNSSEESFGTPKSTHSADEFHEPAESFHDKTGKTLNFYLPFWSERLSR